MSDSSKERPRVPNKVVILMRHSLKGPDGHITPEGLRLARSAGARFYLAGGHIERAGHSIWPRTEETLTAFLDGFNAPDTERFPEPLAVVGTAEFYSDIELCTPAYMAAIKTEGHFDALFTQHSPQKIGQWCCDLNEGLKSVFADIKYGAWVLIVGNSPAIELNALGLDPKLGKEFHNLQPLEAIMFVQGQDGVIKIAGKLTPAQ